MGRNVLFYSILGLFMTVSIGQASDPDEWMRFYKEVNTKCTKASGLIKARQVGELGESFSMNNDAFEVVLIRGLHNEPDRKNIAGNTLCLFDKVKRKCECNEVDQWFISTQKAQTAVTEAAKNSQTNPGGLTKQNPESPEYQEIIKKAETLINEKYKITDFKISKLQKIYTQVVAGINYKLIGDYKDSKGEGKIEILINRDLKSNYSITWDNYKKRDNR